MKVENVSAVVIKGGPLNIYIALGRDNQGYGNSLLVLTDLSKFTSSEKTDLEFSKALSLDIKPILII